MFSLPLQKSKITMIAANDPSLTSWIEVRPDNDFPIQNLPLGIFRSEDQSPRVATIVGNKVVDLAALQELGYLEGLNLPPETLESSYLNDLIATGKKTTRALRERLSKLLREDTQYDTPSKADQFLYDVESVKLQLPVRVGDYTDFYSSKEHATNVGSMFRDPDNALLPNWLHLPVGYHGRASSIIVSGTPVHRPKGQQMPQGADSPVFGPSRLLDFELEMAFIVGRSTQLGDSIAVNEAEDYIFGLTLFNDWSARDIQKWEYVPLGPFLGKSFASTISPWIVTLDALEPFRTASPKQEPEPLPYLKLEGAHNFDLKLEVLIQPDGEEPSRVCRSNFKHMYWSMAQQLAHHTVNGCNVNVGDMMASGTISGPTKDSYGSMLELSWRGTIPVKLKDGSERKFILDGDNVIMRGYGEKDGVRIGFGDCEGKVLPAV
jgi:fumarylacetoacetase